MLQIRDGLLLLVSVGLLLPLAACRPPPVQTDMRLTEVRRPEDVSEEWGEYEISEAEEEGYAYEDELVRVVTIPTNMSFTLIIENKTEHTVQLVWDQASFVGPDGNSSRVTSGQTKVKDVGQSQPATPIPAKAKTDVTAIPNVLIYDSDGDGIDDVNPMFSAADSAEFEDYEGEKMRLVVPLKVEDTVNEYTFVYDVRDLSIGTR